jgi:hypothetical protein
MFKLFSALDAAIQRHVDATAFFFMRTYDVGKSKVRVALHLILVSTWIMRSIGPMAAQTSRGEQTIAWICTSMFLGMTVAGYRLDRIAESSKMALSPVDAYLMTRGTFLKTIMCLLLATEVVPFLIEGAPQSSRTLAFMQMVSWVPMMTLIYFGATPPTPPPEEERETARNQALVPVPIPTRNRR